MKQFNLILHTTYDILRDFREKRRKLTYASLFLLIVSVPTAIYLLRTATQTEATWYSDNWQYRTKHTITNNESTTLTDYQVSLTLDTATLITAGKLQSDCADIRVTDKQGNALPYWVQESDPGCNDSATKIWFKLNTLPTSSAEIFVYYGNPVASDAGSGDDVFTFFDNFPGSSLDTGKWSTVLNQGTIAVTSGYLQMSRPSGGNKTHIETGSSFSSNLIIEYRQKIVQTNYYYGSVYYGTSPNISSICYVNWSGYESSLYTGDAYYPERCASGASTVGDIITVPPVSGTWFSEKFVIPTTKISRTLDGTTTETSTNYDGVSSGKIGIYGASAGSAGMESHTDWIFARKYTTNEPTVSAAGEESRTPGPIAYWKFDEGTGQTANDSANNNDGQLGSTTGSDASDPTWIGEEQCVTGKCLQFDGSDDYVDSTWTAVAGQRYTVTMWFKRSSLSANNASTLISGGYGGDQDGILLYSDDYAGTTGEVSLDTGSSTLHQAYLNGQPVSNGFIVDNNEWAFIAFDLTVDTQDGGTHFIGANNNGSNFFDGFIDDVKIYPYARTADQIKVDYAAGAAVLGDTVSTDTDPGLVGYWSMDEASGQDVFDNSGSDNHGTRGVDSGSSTDDPTWTSSSNCQSETCLDFDGYDYVQIPENDSLDPSTISICSWVYLTSSAAGRNIVDKGDNTGYRYRIDQTARTISWFDRGGTNYITSNTAIGLNEWSHVCVTGDSSGLKIYINGNLDKSGGSAYGGPNTGSDLRIGNDFGVSDGGWIGKIDEVKIYNYARTQAQIQEDMNAHLGADPLSPYLVSHWTFDEGYGQAAHDSVGSNDGTRGANTGSSTDDPTWKTKSDCKVNGCLDLDGGDFIEIGDVASLDFTSTDPRTISAWIYTDSSNSGFVFAKIDDDQPYRGYDFGLNSNGILVSHMSNTWDTNAIKVISQQSVNNASWHHVVLTYDGSETASGFQFYIDGVPELTSATNTTFTPGSDITSSYPATVGARNDGSNQQVYFTGHIDEVKVYAAALTPAQVLLDMNAGTNTSFGVLGDSEAADLSDGAGNPPVAHWNMDEKTGQYANDISGNDNQGTLGAAASAGSDDPTWQGKVDCHEGGCLEFDGNDDYINIPNASSFKPTLPLTISTWVNVNDLSSVNGVFMNDNFYAESTGNYYGVAVNIETTGQISLHYGDGSGTSSSSRRSKTSSSTISAGQWHHITGVYVGNTDMSIYIDGSDAGGSYSGTGGSLSYTSNDGRIGETDRDNNFPGLIDDVKIYDYARTPAQVAYDYNRGAPIAHWRLDDNVSGNGATILDSSGNANHGTTDWGANASGMDCTVSGKRNLGCDFDGVDDYITITNSEEYNFTQDQPFAVTVWIKLNSVGSESRIINKQQNNTNELIFALTINSTGKPIFGLGKQNVGADSAVGITTFASGTWYHLTGLYDGTNIKLYVNGIEEDSVTETIFAKNQSTASLYIGQLYNNTLRFPGLIDDVRIYNYALSPSQIHKIMNESAVRFGPAEGSP